MAFSPFRKIRLVTEDDLTAKNINTFQDNVSSALSQVLGKDQLDSTIIKNQKLIVGLNKVPHMLGRNLSGYIVVRCYGGYPFIYDTQDVNPSPNLLLYLMSSTNTTVDLFVF